MARPVPEPSLDGTESGDRAIHKRYIAPLEVGFRPLGRSNSYPVFLFSNIIFIQIRYSYIKLICERFQHPWLQTHQRYFGLAELLHLALGNQPRRTEGRMSVP